MASIRWITLGLVFGVASGVGGFTTAPVSAQNPCDMGIPCGEAVSASEPCDPGFPSASCIAPPVAPVLPPPPPVEIDFCVWNAAACGEAMPAEP